MSDKPENPPAFPEASFNRIGDVSHGTTYSGMTLRDYFAAHAPISLELFLNGLSREQQDKGMAYILQMFAIARGQYADAMLAERAKITT